MEMEEKFNLLFPDIVTPFVLTYIAYIPNPFTVGTRFEAVIVTFDTLMTLPSDSVNPLAYMI